MICPQCGTVFVKECPRCKAAASSKSVPYPPHGNPPPAAPGGGTGNPGGSNNNTLLIVLLSVIGGLIILGGVVLTLLLTGVLNTSDSTRNATSAYDTADTVSDNADIAVATPTPAPTAEPTPTPEPVHTYEAVQASISWSDARERAEAAGGHLITINSEEEEEEAISLAEAYGLEYVWIGGYTSTDGGLVEGHWITGEAFTYSDWMSGEPSHTDLDNAYEDRIMLWKINGEWSWNDQRNSDMSDIYGPNTRAKMGYIIEYEQ